MGKHTAGSYQPETEMTIYHAAALKGVLLAEVEACKELEVDLSNVVEIDSAGLQLLIMAKREAQIRGHQLRLVNHSPAVVEVLDLCNLVSFFGDPVVLTSTRG